MSSFTSLIEDILVINSLIGLLLLILQDYESKRIFKKRISSFTNAIIQIIIIDFIFSIDSILTAVGMTNNLSPNPNHALVLMIIAVVISIFVMMLFANGIRTFVERHPSIQILGLSFLILIGFMLITESAHLSHTRIFDQEIGAIPKGYLYFAIAFSLFVEFLNLKMSKKPAVKETVEKVD